MKRKERKTIKMEEKKEIIIRKKAVFPRKFTC